MYCDAGWEYGTKCTLLLERYEIEANVWTCLAPIPTPRRLHGFVYCKGK